MALVVIFSPNVLFPDHLFFSQAGFDPTPEGQYVRKDIVLLGSRRRPPWPLRPGRNAAPALVTDQLRRRIQDGPAIKGR